MNVKDSVPTNRYKHTFSTTITSSRVLTRFAGVGEQVWTTEILQKFLHKEQHEDEQTLEACEFIVKSFEPVDENQNQKLLSAAGMKV